MTLRLQLIHLCLALVGVAGCASSKPAADGSAAAAASRDTARQDDPPSERRVSASGRRPRGPGGVMIDPVQFGTLDGRPLSFELVQPEEPVQPPMAVIIRLDVPWDGPTVPATVLSRLAERGAYVCLRVPCANRVDPNNPVATPECANAIQWIMANTQSCQITPDRMGVWVSSGESEIVSTLQRGTLVVQNQEVLERGDAVVSRVATFFDRHLQSGVRPIQASASGRQWRGGGRGRMPIDADP